MPIPAGGATPDLFATVDELRSWVGDASLDLAAANLYLAAATAAVQSATGQDFTFRAGDVVTLDATEDQWLHLPQRPVTAVSTLAVNGTAQATSTWTLSNGRVFRADGWGRGLSYIANAGTNSTGPTVITVTYSHGYVVIPADVKAATLAIAADLAANPTGLSGENVDDYSWRRSDTAAGTAAVTLLASVVRRYGRTSRSVRLSSR